MDIFALGLAIRATGVAEATRDLTSLDGVGKRVASTFTSLGSVIAGLGLAELGRQAVGAGFAFLKDSIKDAAEAESALSSLRAAVRNVGVDFEKVAPRLNKAADAFNNLTFGDEAARNALARMLPITRDVDGSIRGLAVAADLAAFKHIGLEEAATLVAKAMVGQTGMLQRYGIEIREGTDAVEELRKVVGGFAQAEANTFSGRLAVLNNQWGEFKEAIGTALLASGNMGRGVSDLSSLIQKATQYVQDHSGEIQRMVHTVVAELPVAGRAIILYADGFRAVGEHAMLAARIVHAFLSRDYSLIDAAKDQWNGYATSIRRIIDDWGKLKGAQDEATQSIANFAPAAIAAATGASGAIGGIVSAIHVPQITITPDVIKIVAPKEAPSLKIDQIKVEALPEIPESDYVRFARSVQQNFGNAISDGFAGGFARAIQSGSIGEGMRSLLGSFTSALGDMLIAIGKRALLASELVAKFVKLFVTLNPASVGAALAIIALGGVLKGLGGAGSGGGGSSGSAGGGGSYFGAGAGVGSSSSIQVPVGATGASQASRVTPAPSVSYNFMVIGEDDPRAHRSISNIVQNARARGLPV